MAVAIDVLAGVGLRCVSAYVQVSCEQNLLEMLKCDFAKCSVSELKVFDVEVHGDGHLLAGFCILSSLQPGSHFTV